MVERTLLDWLLLVLAQLCYLGSAGMGCVDFGWVLQGLAQLTFAGLTMAELVVAGLGSVRLLSAGQNLAEFLLSRLCLKLLGRVGSSRVGLAEEARASIELTQLEPIRLCSAEPNWHRL